MIVEQKNDLFFLKKNKNKWLNKTPCFIINKKKFRSTLKDIKKFLPGEILYSYKTNNHNYIAKSLLSNKCGFLLSSIEEAQNLIKNVGVDPQKTLFQSPSLTKKQLDEIIKLGISRMVIDSWKQLEIITSSIEKFSQKPELLIRINTGVKIEKPELNYSSDSFLGFPIKEALEVFEHLNKLRKENKIILGVHNHFLSQNTFIKKWEENLKSIEKFTDQLKNKNIILDIVDFGGGYPVEYSSQNLELSKISILINKTLKNINKNYPEIRFIFEPGRKVVAESISLVAEVSNIKKFLGKEIAILNCSVYNASMDTLIVNLFLKPQKIGLDNSKKLKKYIIRGSTPDSLDVFSKEAKLPELKIGDHIVFKNAGAYSFWSDFISLKKPEYIVI